MLASVALALLATLLLGARDAPARRIAAGGMVAVETTVEKDSVRIGERLRVRYRFQFPDSLRMVRFARLPQGRFSTISLRWQQERREGARVETATAVLFTLDREKLSVPPFHAEVVVSGGDTLEVRVPEVEVPVRLVAKPGASMRPLKEQWTPPPSRRWLLLLAGALAAAALAALIVRKLRKAKPAEEPSRPALPPDFVALQELSRIEAMGLPEKGEFKTYYTLVVDALRSYLEARFGIEAMDRTSAEILEQLRGAASVPEGLEELLAEADLVKFAKFVPDLASARRAMESARRIVATTAPPREEAAAATG